MSLERNKVERVLKCENLPHTSAKNLYALWMWNWAIFSKYWRCEQFLYRTVVFENSLSPYFIQALYPMRNLAFIASGTVAFSQHFARSQTMIGSIRWILIEKLRYWCWCVSSSKLNVRSCTLEDVKEAATLWLSTCRRLMLYH